MATNRYRIHFIASFDQVIEAEDGSKAQLVAEGGVQLFLDTLGAAHHIEDVRCVWNTIEPLGGDDD